MDNPSKIKEKAAGGQKSRSRLSSPEFRTVTFCVDAPAGPIKGKPFITLTNQTTVLYGKRRKHSQKPEEFFPLVESLSPARRRLAMFFDITRPGWECYG